MYRDTIFFHLIRMLGEGMEDGEKIAEENDVDKKSVKRRAEDTESKKRGFFEGLFEENAESFLNARAFAENKSGVAQKKAGNLNDGDFAEGVWQREEDTFAQMRRISPLQGERFEDSYAANKGRNSIFGMAFEGERRKEANGTKDAVSRDVIFPNGSAEEKAGKSIFSEIWKERQGIKAEESETASWTKGDTFLTTPITNSLSETAPSFSMTQNMKKEDMFSEKEKRMSPIATQIGDSTERILNKIYATLAKGEGSNAREEIPNISVSIDNMNGGADMDRMISELSRKLWESRMTTKQQVGEG